MLILKWICTTHFQKALCINAFIFKTKNVVKSIFIAEKMKKQNITSISQDLSTIRFPKYIKQTITIPFKDSKGLHFKTWKTCGSSSRGRTLSNSKEKRVSRIFPTKISLNLCSSNRNILSIFSNSNSLLQTTFPVVLSKEGAERRRS